MTLPEASHKERFVERMFDTIAPRYDLMNRLMTLGIDRGWRRAAIAALGLRRGDLVIDVGCGTGDLGEEAIGAGVRAIGVDVSSGMLAMAARRHSACVFVRADAQQLPFADTSCDAIVSGFALRNFGSVERALGESARVLRKGGRIALLEIDVPSSAPGRLAFDVYFGRLVPLMGRLLSKGYAYRYLSASLAYLPSENELTGMLAGAGFERVSKSRLAMGTAQLVTATRG